MNRMLKTKIAALTLSGLLISGSALADDKTLTESFDYQGEVLHLDVGVGQVELIASNSDQIEIQVELEGAETGFLFFGDKRDVSDIELDVQLNEGKRLSLSLSDSEDVKEEWRILLPASVAVNLEMGVGRVETRGMDNSLEIDLGVGEVEVNHSHQYDDVELTSGVGDVSFSMNGKKAEVERAMVSASYSASLNGQGNLHVDVGVGEVDVNGK
ncbi:hypothetical protein L2750_08885 [Shewanella submarina]|uniref:Adhesin domain-containing protein n=1 Tax=Shewanella submarina TaxID=2016376 RepID=A0ABV7GA33_9GAMM|nr:hypothetical protein [Shewanella submarina]MCL1037268.1 hypothetical protein [Shewanella submarina]